MSKEREKLWKHAHETITYVQEGSSEDVQRNLHSEKACGHEQMNLLQVLRKCPNQILEASWGKRCLISGGKSRNVHTVPPKIIPIEPCKIPVRNVGSFFFLSVSGYETHTVLGESFKGNLHFRNTYDLFLEIEGNFYNFKYTIFSTNTRCSLEFWNILVWFSCTKRHIPVKSRNIGSIVRYFLALWATLLKTALFYLIRILR